MQSDTAGYKQSPANDGRTVHRWEVADRQIVITVRAGVAGAVWQDVDERGQAACGFLLGRMLNTGEGQCLHVDSIMPLVLNPGPEAGQLPDLGRFGAAMSRWHHAGKGRAQWAGCYVARFASDEVESTILPALYAPLFTTDIAAVMVLVPKSGDCDCRLEVVSPSIVSGVVPEFRFRLGEYVEAEKPFHIVDNDHPLVIEAPSDFLTAPDEAAPEPAVAPPIEKVVSPPPALRIKMEEAAPAKHERPHQPVVVEAAHVGPPSPAPARPPRYRRWFWISLALLAGGGAGVLAGRLWRLTQHYETGSFLNSSAAPESTRTGNKLDLQVARHGTDLELTWNRSLEALEGNARGEMRINDNGYRSEILLDASQIRNGRILYVPRSGDVEVSLQVKTAGGATLADTLRVLQPGFAAQGPANAAAPSTQVPARTSPAPTGTAQRTVPEVIKPRPKEFVLPPATGDGKAAGAQPGTFRIEPAVLGASMNGLPSSPIPFSPPSVAPPPETTIRTPERPAARAAVMPAVPLRQASLAIPQDLRVRLNTELTINVEVSLDAAGRVLDVRPERQATPAATELAGLAAANVRRWQFRPATVGGQPVASKYVVTFHVKR